MTPAGSRHLAALGAAPRPAGGASAAHARAYCAGVLADAGFGSAEQVFEYSAFPGAWATPVGGAVAALAATGLWWARRAPAMGVISLAAVIVAGGALAVLGRDGVLRTPFMRRTGVNLQAVRGSGAPALWLVAHVDSKWQPIPMLARVAGLLLTVLGLAALVTGWVGGASPALMLTLLVLAWAGCALLMASVVGARNHGTLDNASGVATVLAALDHLPSHLPIGVLVTDAEELALAGVRAWALAHRAGTAINVDTIDDAGPLTVMFSGRRPVRLAAALEQAAAGEGETCRVMRLVPGILTDSVALAGAGWETLTLSRGTIRTLGRIHTSRDTLAAMDGRGIDGAARVLARAAAELVGANPVYH